MVATSPVRNQPSASKRCRLARFVVVVGADDPRSAHQELAAGDPVLGEALAVGADDLELDAVERPALARAARVLGLPILGQMLGLRESRGCRPGSSRSCPSHGCKFDAVALGEGARSSRAAPPSRRTVTRLTLSMRLPVCLEVLQEAEPDRRHAERRRSLPRPSKSSCRLAPSSLGPGEDELRAGHRRGVGDAPGIDVEHRHDRADRLVHRDPDRVRRADRVGYGAASSDGYRARPWDCRSCRRCSRARTRCSRRTPATRARGSRRRRGPRSRARWGGSSPAYAPGRSSRHSA